MEPELGLAGECESVSGCAWEEVGVCERWARLDNRGECDCACAGRVAEGVRGRGSDTESDSFNRDMTTSACPATIN